MTSAGSCIGLRTLVLGALAGTLLALVPAAPSFAACTALQKLLGCKDPVVAAPLAAPDPGGTPGIDQPVPVAGKGFGFNQGAHPAGEGNPDKGIAAMRAIGTPYYRTSVEWSGYSATHSNPYGDMYRPFPASGGSIAYLDKFYLDLRAAGITPVFMIMNAPQWASMHYQCLDGLYRLFNQSKCPNGWEVRPHVHPNFFAKFRQFVTAVTQRYPAAVIEGANEPDYAWNNGYGSAIPAWRAAQEHCEVYKAVKAVDPNRTVLSPGMGEPIYMRDYLASSADAQRCHNAFSLHSYAHGDIGAGSIHAKTINVIRTRHTAVTTKPTIWLTETGETFRPGIEEENEPLFTSWLKAIYNQWMTMPDTGPIFFHALRDAFDKLHTDTAKPEYHFGFLRADWSPKGRWCWLVTASGRTADGC